MKMIGRKKKLGSLKKLNFIIAIIFEKFEWRFILIRLDYNIKNITSVKTFAK